MAPRSVATTFSFVHDFDRILEDLSSECATQLLPYSANSVGSGVVIQVVVELPHGSVLTCAMYREHRASAMERVASRVTIPRLP